MSDVKIPDAEADVLAVLFEEGEATARTVRERLAKRRPMAHGSVVTLLTRLEERGLVKRRKADQGKAFVFRPAKAHARAFGPAVSRLLQRAFGGKPAALVASLFETAPPTREELDDLEALVARLREQRK
ncbi:MAG TPA: BlaI/MecI/CopY family transcriptional regulator [Vicinamibacterales bacterium]|nr:BlaI/MecI/CopY family transcriptional regulator [Vicinamibacterales bacterium]